MAIPQSAQSPDGSIEARPLRHPGQWLSALIIIAAAVAFMKSAATNSAYDWETYRTYLFDERVLRATLVTLELTVLAMVLGIILGAALAILRLSPNRVLSTSSMVFLWVFRGTPLYVQLVFWGLLTTIYPAISLGFTTIDLQNLNQVFWLAVIGLGLNESAYMAEVVRGGILSVGTGQTEAATALGMSWAQSMRRVVLPQAMRVIIPPTGNELIGMLKNTSLVVAIPYSLDLYARTSDIATPIFRPVPLLLVASTWYLVVTSVLMIGQFYLEKRFARGVSRVLTVRQLQALADAQHESPEDR